MVAVVVGVVALVSWRRTARQRRAAREAAAARRLARAEREQRRQAKLAAFREANQRARRRRNDCTAADNLRSPTVDNAAEPLMIRQFPTVGPEARSRGQRRDE